MREQLKDRNRLEHILQAINQVFEFADGMTYEQFCEDKLKFAAITYHTMIVGEAAYMLSKTFVEKYADTPWSKIKGMRHYVVHGYYQVRKDILWNVVLYDLRPLKEQITRYLAETDRSQWEKEA